MEYLSDVIKFVKSLSYSDIIFFLAVLALMLLVISLIYFIKENADGVETEDDIKEQIPKGKGKDDSIISLEEITKALEKTQNVEKNVNNNLTNYDNYEAEQEEKAIISYEELLERKNNYAINYTEEKNINNDLTVKKVDLDNLVNESMQVPNNIKVEVISYEKEEAFLQALKALQEKLN